MPRPSSIESRTFINPVYPHSFPDPFVLKFGGYFYAYSTGHAADGLIFEMLRSRDLVNWEAIGGAMSPLDPSPPYYWAPEVTYSNGKFYLYYSVGNETLMEIRVAVSDRPDGGFLDSGIRLTNEDFAIDAHVFVDDDGRKYFFYATDFLEHTHIGTGTVVDRMIDWFTLEGRPRPVTRAKYDWQVYDPNRKEKGGVRWHTVEGPAVLKRKGLYYEMFSGGNWQNTTYGVSFAVTKDLESQEEWIQYSDGEKVLPILRTIPEIIVGPGHNSVVRGPNNRELYCVYHRWTDNGRVLAIDRMDFAGSRIFVAGGTHTEQPFPFAPTISAVFPEAGMPEGFQESGEWKIQNGELASTSEAAGFVEFAAPAEFLAEVAIRSVKSASLESNFGIALIASGNVLAEVRFYPAKRRAVLNGTAGGPYSPKEFAFDDAFQFNAPQLLQIEASGGRVKFQIAGSGLNMECPIDATPTHIRLISEVTAATFTAFELTEGFEDLFDDSEDPAQRGWKTLGDADISILDNEVSLRAENDVFLTKGGAYFDLEFAANIRLGEPNSHAGRVGVVLIGENERPLFKFGYDCVAGLLFVEHNGEMITATVPSDLDIGAYHQFRIIRSAGSVISYLTGIKIFETSLKQTQAAPGIFLERCSAFLEMARLTVLGQPRE